MSRALAVLAQAAGAGAALVCVDGDEAHVVAGTNPSWQGEPVPVWRLDEDASEGSGWRPTTKGLPWRAPAVAHSLGGGTFLVLVEPGEADLGALAPQVELVGLVWQASAEEGRAQVRYDVIESMTRDMRTPIGAITGMSELLLEGELPPEQRVFATNIQKNARMLRDLAEDLLTMARIDAGAEAQRAETIGLRALVDEVLQQQSAAAGGAELHSGIDPRLPATVIGDGARLRELVERLVTHALRSARAGEVEVRLDWLGQARASVDVALLVRAHPARTGGVDIHPLTGSGQGSPDLRVCESLTEAMGGRLSTVQRRGQGSTVTARLAFAVAHHDEPGLRALRDAVRGVRVAIHASEPGARRAVVNALNGAEVELVEPGQACDVHLVDEGDAPAEGLPTLEPEAPTLLLERPGAAHRADVPSVSKPLAQASLLGAIGDAVQAKVVPSAGGVEAKRPPGLRVLFVDDDAMSRAVTQRALARAGHDVAMAADGLEGLARLQAEDFDIVLMDLYLPGVDGIEATRRLREWEREQGRASTPVVAITGEDHSDLRALALDTGCDGFLTKPVQAGELLKAVARTVHPQARVLCVDDSRDTRRAVQIGLRRKGYLVTCAADGAAALDQLERNPFDVVLMDIEMPGVNGIDAVRQIREREWSLPVIAMTGHTDTETHQQVFRAGFNDLLIKPFARAEVLECVEQWLDLTANATIPPDADLQVLLREVRR